MLGVLCIILLRSSAVKTRCNIVKYYIDSYRNWCRISIRCWIHKRHPYHRSVYRNQWLLFRYSDRYLTNVSSANPVILDPPGFPWYFELALPNTNHWFIRTAIVSRSFPWWNIQFNHHHHHHHHYHHHHRRRRRRHHHRHHHHRRAVVVILLSRQHSQRFPGI